MCRLNMQYAMDWLCMHKLIYRGMPYGEWISASKSQKWRQPKRHDQQVLDFGRERRNMLCFSPKSCMFWTLTVGFVYPKRVWTCSFLSSQHSAQAATPQTRHHSNFSLAFLLKLVPWAAKREQNVEVGGRNEAGGLCDWELAAVLKRSTPLVLS